MTISFLTQTGVKVDIAPTPFIEDLDHPRKPGKRVIAPLMRVAAELLSAPPGKRVFETKFLAIQNERNCFAIFLIRVGSHLSALLVDVANPMLKRWASEAKLAGYLPMLLQRRPVSTLLDFQFDSAVEDILLRRPAQSHADIDSAEKAAEATMFFAKSIELQHMLLPRGMKLQSVQIHVVVSEVASTAIQLVN